MPARTAPSVKSQVTHRLERVVVPVPDREVARGQPRRDLLGLERRDVEAERRHAAGHRRQAVELDSVRQPGEEPLPERVLVRLDRIPAERVDVVHGRDEAREELVRERAELEAVPDRLVGGGADLVRPPGAEEVALAEREPEVRPEELVRRADEDVDVPGGDVDRPVRRVVDGVRPRERARLVRERDETGHVRRGPDGVRGHGERDDARALGQERREVVVVELELVGHARDADDDPEVVRELEPGRDVGVVVERGDDDLVALAQRPRERAREQEVERGHARAERDLVRRAAEEARGADARAARRARPSVVTSRTARRRSRSTRAGSRRSRR